MENAAIPSLDRHIALLRSWILAAGLPVIEVPPVPSGHAFTVCLTHDVDHPVLRNHRGDATLAGFLLRATAGSLVKGLKRRLPWRDVVKNWTAAMKTPLVLLGWARDPWRQTFGEYARLEQPAGSTFFVIPFRGRPGRGRNGQPAPPARAAGYDARDVAGELTQMSEAGCEVGLHGIDAWHEAASAEAERSAVATHSGKPANGVRMHWLYFDRQSAAALDRAGFQYDSTVGYNEAVGFRAGTSQVYRPLDAKHLLELPLHVMDTALFYPDRMNLSPAEARSHVDQVVAHAGHEGGTVTINWHDRSIAPERLWGDFYVGLMESLRRRGAWFAIASRAVTWFRRRRSVRFEMLSRSEGRATFQISAGANCDQEIPALILRVHRPARSGDGGVETSITDQPLDERELTLTI